LKKVERKHIKNVEVARDSYVSLLRNTVIVQTVFQIFSTFSTEYRK